MSTAERMDMPAGITSVGTVSEIATTIPLKKCIGIVRLWPDRPVAEHECIQRLTVAAARIGVDVIEVDQIGFRTDHSGEQVTSADVDFVLHLHYATPKTYDCFSIGALWNPIEFYFDWGFDIYMGNQISHDDYASAGATSAEDIIVRCRPEEFQRGRFPILNHSLCEPIIPPRYRTDRRAFYCGINWEAVNGGPGRHSQMLKAIDEAALLDIYGPNNIEGVHPWKGYRGYRKPLPFDGISLVHAAAESGAVLVISSEPHKHSGVMSNRLFECLASGSLIIGDSHPFLRKHFADCALTIDDTQPPSQQAGEVIEKLAWANANPDATLELIRRGQYRFLQCFTLDHQLLGVYRHFVAVQERRTEMRSRRAGRSKLSICVVPVTNDRQAISGMLSALSKQTVDDFEVIVAKSPGDQEEIAREFTETRLGHRLRLVPLHGGLDQPFGNMGALVGRLLSEAAGDVIAISLGIERYFSTFVETILGRLIDDAAVDGVLCNGLLEHFSEGRRLIDLNDLGWQPLHPALIGMIAVRRRSYERIRPLFDYVDAETWSRLLSLGLAGPTTTCRVPQTIIRLSDFEASLKRVAHVLPILPLDRVQTLVSNFVPPNNVTARPQLELLTRADRVEGVRRVVDHEIRTHLTAETVANLPANQRMLLAVELLKSLPLPRSFVYGIRQVHRFYRRLIARLRSFGLVP
jgi:hypothetical protein